MGPLTAWVAFVVLFSALKSHVQKHDLTVGIYVYSS